MEGRKQSMHQTWLAPHENWRDLLTLVTKNQRLGHKKSRTGTFINAFPASSKSPTHRNCYMHAQVCDLLQLQGVFQKKKPALCPALLLFKSAIIKTGVVGQSSVQSERLDQR